nr:parathymosin isoform X1 [Peromyscus maniculatus bairdii]
MERSQRKGGPNPARKNQGGAPTIYETKTEKLNSQRHQEDLKEKKEKVEEKAGRKERKKEVVEVWRWPRSAPTSFPLFLPSWGCWGPASLLAAPPFLPYPESFHRPVSGNTASLTALAPCLGPHRRRRMELRKKKKKLPRMERMMMKEMKKDEADPKRQKTENGASA